MGGGDGCYGPAGAWALPWVPVHRVGEVAAFWSLGAWVLLFTRPGGVRLFPEVLAFLPSCLCFPLGSVSFVLAALGLSPAHSAWVCPHGCYVLRCGRGGHINQHFTSSGTLTHTILYLLFVCLGLSNGKFLKSQLSAESSVNCD